MAFYNKIKWVLGILMVFFLIVATNLIDKNNFVRVRDSVVTIYEDRLIAKDLIFKMLKTIHQKETAVTSSDSAFFNQTNIKVNNNLQALISRFEATKLTAEESKVFSDLKENVQLLLDSENRFLNSGFSDRSQVVNQITIIKENLDDLSKIQLNEGNKQMLISKRAVDTVELFTQIEIYMLIFLAVLVQIIVMYKPKDNA